MGDDVEVAQAAITAIVEVQRRVGCGGPPLGHTVDGWSPSAESAEDRAEVDAKQAAVEEAAKRKDATAVAVEQAEAKVSQAEDCNGNGISRAEPALVRWPCARCSGYLSWPVGTIWQETALTEPVRGARFPDSLGPPSA